MKLKIYIVLAIFAFLQACSSVSTTTKEQKTDKVSATQIAGISQVVKSDAMVQTTKEAEEVRIAEQSRYLDGGAVIADPACLKKNHKYVKNSEYKDAPSVVCIEKN
jgi:uncharacterized protein YceK